jgi:hypothetical protein
MSLGMMLPMLGTGIGFVVAAMKAKKLITQEGTKATGQAIVAHMVEMGVISAKTAATWGNTLANLANLLSNPFTIALAAVAIAAIIGVTAWIGSKTKATEQNT